MFNTTDWVLVTLETAHALLSGCRAVLIDDDYASVVELGEITGNEDNIWLSLRYASGNDVISLNFSELGTPSDTDNPDDCADCNGVVMRLKADDGEWYWLTLLYDNGQIQSD